jgi:hypothetical protein
VDTDVLLFSLPIKDDGFYGTEATFMAKTASGDTTPVVERLQEYVNNAGVKPVVDRENGIIHGVKLLGLQSRNKGARHFAYPPSTHAKIVSVLEGAVSNVDHHDQSKGEKVSYRDRIGIFRNIRPTADGSFGDFHFNPKHPVAEQLCWDAEHAPEKLGFSILGDGKINRNIPGKPVVEDIISIVSVDLVANPATTNGLFESEDDVLPDDQDQRELCEHGLSAVADARSILLSQESIENKTSRLQEVLSVWQAELTGVPATHKENPQMDWKDVTEVSLKENCPDLYAKVTGTDAVSKLNGTVKTLQESITAKDAALKEATDKLAAVEAEKVAQAKTIAIAEELKAAKIDTNDKLMCSDAIMKAISDAPDATVRKGLIESLAALAKPRTPGTPPFAAVGGSVTTTAPKNAKELLERL